VKSDVGTDKFKAFIDKLYAVYNVSSRNAKELKVIFKKQRMIRCGTKHRDIQMNYYRKTFTIADLVLDLGLMSDAVQELPHLAWTLRSVACICTGD
jgi:hypothetical protein